MTMIVRGVITIMATVLLTATVAQPVSAETQHRKYHRAGPPVIVPPPVYGRSFGPGTEYVPPWVRATPNQCWTDEGYGRWSNCSGGGGIR
jgi:hypothetical protein